MGFRSEIDPNDNEFSQSLATQCMHEAMAMTRKMRAQLPKNRDLVDKIHTYGLQPI
jgi:tryptophan halogenase